MLWSLKKCLRAFGCLEVSEALCSLFLFLPPNLHSAVCSIKKHNPGRGAGRFGDKSVALNTNPQGTTNISQCFAGSG